MHRRILLAAALALPLAGCEGMKRQEHGVRLNDSLRAYTEAVRWGNLDAAALFAVPRTGPAPPPDPSTLVGLKVTGFSVRINRIDESAEEADIAISFTYYHEDRGSIRNLEQRADWYWDDARGGWLMDGPLPVFRR